MVKIGDYPQLRFIAWNRQADDLVDEMTALALYERNWRHVDDAKLAPEERAFIHRLVQEHGHGVLHV